MRAPIPPPVPVPAPALSLSPHAINRASLRCLDVWEHTRRPKEGLHDWLLRHAHAARRVPPDGNGLCQHLGLGWAFERTARGIILKTIVRDR